MVIKITVVKFGICMIMMQYDYSMNISICKINQ